jgi:hypothetical protein
VYGFVNDVADRMGVDLSPPRIPQPVFGPGQAATSTGKQMMSEVIRKYNAFDLEPPASATSSEFVAGRLRTAENSKLLSGLAKKPPKSTPLPLQIAWTEEISVEEVVRMRTELTTQLTSAVFDFRRNQQTLQMQFSATEVSTLIKFIFKTVFGKVGLGRATAIVRDTRDGEDAALVHAGVRAHHLALDADVPDQLKVFFQYFHYFIKAQPVRYSPHKQLIRLHERFELYNSYVSLTNGSTVETQQFLNNRGLFTSQGRGWKSVIHSFVAQEMHMSIVQLTNSLQETQSLHILVREFGLGVLVFLPGDVLSL